MPPVELRPLVPDDWRLWRELRRRALAEDPDAFGSTLAEWSGRGDTEARWRQRLSSVPYNLVASVAGTAAGMASATSPGGNGEVELISMWVAPEARRSGVATALIDAVTAWAAARGATRVALDVRVGNRGAVELYRACGFADAGPSPESQPDAPEQRAPEQRAPEQRMVRTLLNRRDRG